MTTIYSSTAQVSDHTYLRAGFKNNIISCFRLYWWSDKSFAVLKRANIFLEQYCLMVYVCIWLTAIDKLVELPCLEAKRINLLPSYNPDNMFRKLHLFKVKLWMTNILRWSLGKLSFFCYKISFTGEMKVNFPSATKETVEESLLQDLFLKLCRKLLVKCVSKMFHVPHAFKKKTIIGCKSYI